MLSSAAQRLLASSRAFLTPAMTRASSLLSKKRKASSAAAAAASKEAADVKSEVGDRDRTAKKTSTSTATTTTMTATTSARAPLLPPKKKQKSSVPSTTTKVKAEAEAVNAAAAAAAAAAAVAPPPSSPPAAAKKKKKKPSSSSSLPPSPNASKPALVSKADRIFAQLAELYPDPPCPLDHASRTQLLVAVMLSAQTTDAKVNECTRTLFGEAPTAEALAELGAQGIERHIRSLGLAPTKAKNVAATARILVERYGGGGKGKEEKTKKDGKEEEEKDVSSPSSSSGDLPLTVTREELESLPGVGRKTASVVLSMSGVASALPVDTHIDRLSKRWGFSRPDASVLQVESDLCSAFARHEGEFHRFHLRLIYFGREHCPAQRHERSSCPICSWAAV